MALTAVTNEGGGTDVKDNGEAEAPVKNMTRSAAMKKAWRKRRANAAAAAIESENASETTTPSPRKQRQKRGATTAHKVAAAEKLLEVMSFDAKAASELLGWVLKLKQQETASQNPPF